MTLAGAAVVFATYVEKDILLEKRKEAVHAMASLKDTLRRDSDYESLHAGLQTIKSRLDWQSFQSKPASDRRRIITFDAEAVLLQEETRASALEEINLELPDEDRLPETRIDAATEKVEEFRKSIIDRDESAESSSTVTPDPDLYLRQVADYAATALHPLRTELNHSVEDAVERSERKLRHFTWASWGLYAIGWGLALYGRISGAGSVADSE